MNTLRVLLVDDEEQMLFTHSVMFARLSVSNCEPPPISDSFVGAAVVVVTFTFALSRDTVAPSAVPPAASYVPEIVSPYPVASTVPLFTRFPLI